MSYGANKIKGRCHLDMNDKGNFGFIAWSLANG